jgi:tartrate-resistant acid phosphatase type 5
MSFPDLAAKMAPVLAAEKMEFLLALGDNFYESGVKSVDDKQWKTTFEDVYTQEIFQKRWEVSLRVRPRHAREAEIFEKKKRAEGTESLAIPSAHEERRGGNQSAGKTQPPSRTKPATVSVDK